MKRAFCIHRFASVCGVTLFLLLPCSLLAADDEEQEGTREQVEAEDNVTLQVTDGVSQDGEKELIVFDKDKPDEEWEVSVRVKFHPIPEHEYIIQSKKYNWKVSEGFVVDDPEAARPKIRAKAEAAGTEGRLNLHLQWQEEKLDEKNQPTGETKMHPWSNDKGSMRLLVPEFELESVSYNLGDGGESGALPFYDNSDKPQPILAPEYVKGDTRSAENVGILYKKGITPKMKARFEIRPTTAGDIVLYADQQELVPSARSEDGKKLSGTAKQAILICTNPLPNEIRSGTAKHEWRWSVYGREIKPQIKASDNEPKSIISKVQNTFIILGPPNICNQQPWINCMKYGIERLDAKGSSSEWEMLKKIVPSFKGSVQYPSHPDGTPDGNVQLIAVNSDIFGKIEFAYDSLKNITKLFQATKTKSKVSVNCSDSAVSIFVISELLGDQGTKVSVVNKPEWYYEIGEINGIKQYERTSHTYNLYERSRVFDGTPAWGSDSGNCSGPQQQGTLTEQEFFTTPPWNLHPDYRDPGFQLIPRRELIW